MLEEEVILREDQRSRPRAETKTRNGTEKRRSFFGRSRAPPSSSQRKTNVLPGISDEHWYPDLPIARPSTSLGQTSTLLQRKTPDVTSERSSSRNSLFRRTNSLSGSSVKSESSGGGISSILSFYSRDSTTHRDLNQHPNKFTTLPPVQRQPTNQYSNKPYAPLETVNERDLQSPHKDFVNDNDADFAGQQAPKLPAAARISCFDDTIFNTVKSLLLDPGEWHENRQPGPVVVLRDSLIFQEEPILQINDIDCTSNPQSSFSQSETSHPGDGLVEDRQMGRCLSADASPVADQTPFARSSESFLDSESECSGTRDHLDVPYKRPNAAKASQSSRSSISTGRSTVLSFSGNVRDSLVFADSGWEDDIDFVYEQQAEATCDFDWESTDHDHTQISETNRDVKETKFSSETLSSTQIDYRSSQVILNDETDTEREGPGRAVVHARGSSVGHRGFAAARNSKYDDPSMTLKHLPLKLGAGPIPSDILSPVYSVNESDDEAPQSPLTPDKFEFPMPPGGSKHSESPLPSSSGMMKFSIRHSGDRTSVETFSELDSLHWSSMHGKSNSNDSYQSFKGTSTAPSTLPSSRRASSDTARWSTISTSSLPVIQPLTFGRPRRASSLSKATAPTTLETLTQHPLEDEPLHEEIDQPRPEQHQDEFVIRRPRTSGDRRLLYAAGRAVQRYRPTTPSSWSRIVYTPDLLDSRVNPLSDC